MTFFPPTNEMGVSLSGGRGCGSAINFLGFETITCKRKWNHFAWIGPTQIFVFIRTKVKSMLTVVSFLG
jgi:hypothetical protein